MSTSKIQQATVWGIRSGQPYFDASLMFRAGYVGIGWSDAGDLNSLPADADVFRDHLERTHQAYTDITARRFAVGAKSLYRFIHVFTYYRRMITSYTMTSQQIPFILVLRLARIISI